MNREITELDDDPIVNSHTQCASGLSDIPGTRDENRSRKWRVFFRGKRSVIKPPGGRHEFCGANAKVAGRRGGSKQRLCHFSFTQFTRTPLQGHMQCHRVLPLYSDRTEFRESSGIDNNYGPKLFDPSHTLATFLASRFLLRLQLLFFSRTRSPERQRWTLRRKISRVWGRGASSNLPCYIHSSNWCCWTRAGSRKKEGKHPCTGSQSGQVERENWASQISRPWYRGQLCELSPWDPCKNWAQSSLVIKMEGLLTTKLEEPLLV